MKSVPYWLDTAPPVERLAAQPISSRADVVIVGAGFTGLSAAVALARTGASVTVLEAGTVGIGASGRNGGMCTSGLCINFLTAVERYGLDAAKSYYLSYNAAIDMVERLVREEQIDCDFKRTGRLTLASKPRHYETLGRTHDALAKRVSHETLLIPRSILRTEIGSDYYHGGLVDPRSAGLHVGKFVRGLAGAAGRLGVRIHEDAPVTKLQRIRGHAHTVATPIGAVQADKVLLATGSTTGSQFLYFQRRIIPVGSFIIVTEPLRDGLADQLMPTRRMASDTKNLLYYFRITPDGRMLFGGRARFALSDARSDRKSGRILEKGMVAVFPQLRGIRIDYCWGGLVDLTVDRMPRAGEHEGLFYAMGYSGHGVQMATYMGAQMAEVMNGRAQANIWRDFPWPAVPLHFGVPWFLPIVGAYYRLQDVLR